MSDGPHRSLPMRRAWKQVAEFADNTAFTAEQVQTAMAAALGADWAEASSKGVIQEVSRILSSDQASMFDDQKVSQLESVRSKGGGAFGQLLVDCAIQRAVSTDSGAREFIAAAGDAVEIWATRRSRQIEEHYLRESSEGRAHGVRNRLEHVISAANCRSIAEQFCRSGTAAALARSAKATALDDGVEL